VDALNVKSLTVVIGGRVLLEEVSFSVKPGEFWAIVGPNGAGKTTLLRVIMGFIKPTKGEITIFGKKPKDAISEGIIGYLPQNAVFNISIKVLDIFRLLKADDKNISRVSLLMGIEDKLERSFSSLSGGEKQRVLIALLLLKKPKLLLLDEPNTGIDVVGQDNFYNTLKGLKEECTILMVTHDVGVVSSFVDKIACLNRKLKYSGDPRGALDCKLLEELYGEKVNLFVHHPECEGCHIYRNFS